MEELNRVLQIPRLSQCRSVERIRFDAMKQKMASDALASGSPANNPIAPDASDIIRLYEQVW